LDFQALALSAGLALATTTLLAVLGLPLAAWLAFGRPRRLRGVAEALVGLPMVLPPTVIGFYLLLATRPTHLVGRTLDHLLGSPLPFSFPGILVASFLFSLPFAVQPMLAAFRAIDPGYPELAWSLGASRGRAFREVVLPMSWPGVVSGLLMGFAHTLGEFGAVLMIGGAIPGRTRTASIALFDQVQAMEYGAAHRTALVLLLIGLCVQLAVQSLRERSPWKA
jgi:molybdate transport system permease protein